MIKEARGMNKHTRTLVIVLALVGLICCSCGSNDVHSAASTEVKTCIAKNTDKTSVDNSQHESLFGSSSSGIIDASELVKTLTNNELYRDGKSDNFNVKYESSDVDYISNCYVSDKEDNILGGFTLFTLEDIDSISSDNKEAFYKIFKEVGSNSNHIKESMGGIVKYCDSGNNYYMLKLDDGSAVFIKSYMIEDAYDKDGYAIPAERNFEYETLDALKNYKRDSKVRWSSKGLVGTSIKINHDKYDEDGSTECLLGDIFDDMSIAEIKSKYIDKADKTGEETSGVDVDDLLSNSKGNIINRQITVNKHAIQLSIMYRTDDEIKDFLENFDCTYKINNKTLGDIKVYMVDNSKSFYIGNVQFMLSDDAGKIRNDDIKKFIKDLKVTEIALS